MLYNSIAYYKWIVCGKQIPAPAEVKRYILYRHAKKYKTTTFIETGTFQGATVAAMAPYFKKLHSIELSKSLYEKACKKFLQNKKIKIWQGDSAKILPQIIKSTKGKILFWLDAHWSGGDTAQGKEWSPVIDELKAICKQTGKSKHVIIIDDARGFTGSGSPTVEKIISVVTDKFPNSQVDKEDDMITFIIR